jgi:NADH dehydrogenase FAD-containing subunit
MPLFGRTFIGAGLGAAAGIASSSSRGPRAVALADEPGRQPQTQVDIEPVKCVVVGGGYAGARIAYQLDSVFHVTMVDKKNYFEASDEITGILTGPEDAVGPRITDTHALHRFYLRRARVVTNTVTDVTEESVILADGRRLPYDILIFAVGETRPYPFAATALTVDVREAELKEYRKLLWREDIKKIAIIGGGPKGCSLASCITSALDKEVHLFHSTSTLAPNLPHDARERLEYVLEQNSRVTLHKNAVVTSVTYTNPPSSGGALSKVVSWWPWGRHQPEAPAEANGADSAYIGAKFALNVSLREGSKRVAPSVLSQAWFGDMLRTPVARGTETGQQKFEDFDLVINCAGNLPNARQFDGSELLSPHIDAEGQFVTSKFAQLHGLPHVFGIGRSSGLRWTKSTGASDYQARNLFRNLLSVANLADSAVSSFVPTMTPVTRLSMSFPRLIVPIDELQAVGSTAWSGSVVGVIALKELMQDRQYFLKEFHKPIFFKQQDDGKVRQSYDKYFATASTDPTDFELE